MSSSTTADQGTIIAKTPAIFEEFFELGLQETVSPFLTPDSRQWGANLTLKAAILAAFLLLLAFALSFFPSVIPLSNMLLVSVYFLAGIPALIESIEDLIDFEINIDILMTLAAFSSVLIGSGMEGALLLVLFALSGSMEDAVTTKAKSSISSLNKLSPTKANVMETDGTILERAIKDIDIGTTILVKSGQVVPLDGTVIEGISSVNLVHLTGENLPILKKPNDEVPAGARNLEGALILTVTRTSSDSTLSRIIQLVTQAQEARPALQRWFDKLSNAYAMTIILLAFFFAMTLPIFLGLPFLGVEGSIYRAIAFLIAASPCALIIAIPIAYLSAISVCARKGILLKGGITLDALASCSLMAFDKTGTLTLGDLTCESIEGLTPNDDNSLHQALAVALAMEKNAVHPIAKAVMGYAQHRNAPIISLKEFKTVPGYGLEALAVLPEGNVNAYIGNPDYIIPKLSDSKAADLLEKTKKIQEKGELLAVLKLGDRIFLFHFRETPRPIIKKTLENLKRKWLMRLVMLTGDHQAAAKRIAEEMGIDEYHANLRPEDKLEYITKLSKDHGLAMVGDGINDAPALARATVGICMGKVGSTAAIDAAEIVLLHDNIELLDWLVSKAHQTRYIVKQNLALAFSAILIASLPALAGFIPLWLAVVLHEGGTVLVGLNALRLLKK